MNKVQVIRGVFYAGGVFVIVLISRMWWPIGTDSKIPVLLWLPIPAFLIHILLSRRIGLRLSKSFSFLPDYLSDVFPKLILIMGLYMAGYVLHRVPL